MDLMSPFPIPLCDPAISPDFLTTITTFRIIVLTYNRPESLYRLLTSIKVYILLDSKFYAKMQYDNC